MASLAGVAASSGTGSTDGLTGFLNIVSAVRGAADLPAPTSGSSFGTLPEDEAALLDRGAPAQLPAASGGGEAGGLLPEATPLPSPVPIDPDATPLPAPGAATGADASAPEVGVAAPPPTSRGVAPPPVTGGLVWPVPAGSISQGFHGGHLAVDIAADYGSQVVAAQAGVVASAGWRNNGGGYVIEIDHGNGMRTIYNHLGSIWVTTGQSVFAGQGIAGVGCTGLCTGPHVHYQVIVNGVIDNPLRYH
jgi:murein DD-endopeptidase MepM/ murein hydrolase activator NlpD